jgi:hypothetical protein
MSSNIDLETQAALDAAIKMLYKSRPAKAAALLGLVDPEPSVKLSVLGTPPSTFSPLNPNPPRDRNSVNIDVEGGIKFNKGDDGPQRKQVTNVSSGISPKEGPSPLTAPVGDSPNIARGQGHSTRTASLYKRAMSEAELLQYYGGAGDLMEATGDPSLTPSQMGMLTAGGVGVTAANRGRAKNVARREVKNIRKQYLQAVQEGALDKQRLKLLNRELKLRGARPTLSLAPTVGIADAQMARAERDLGSKLLSKRYRGAIPLIAASLLGTVAYNQFS